MVLSEYNLAGDALLCRFCSSFESVSYTHLTLPTIA